MARRTRSGKVFGKADSALEREQTCGQANETPPTSSRSLRGKKRIDYIEQMQLERPLRILNSGARLRTAAFKAPTLSSLATSKACKFLADFPAELRNRIYEFVLGNSTIHIWRDDDNDDDDEEEIYQDGVFIGSMFRPICTAEEEEKAHIHKAETQNPAEEQTQHLERHQHCLRSNLTTSPLALIQTCRQIHSEAALIPFYNNTFSFFNIIEIDYFLRRLTSKQARAVQQIALTVPSMADFENYIKSPSVELYAKDWPHRLNGNLDSLLCVIEFGGDREDDFDVSKWKRGRELLEFGRLEIKEVKVVACNVPNWMHDPVSEIVSAKELKEWAKEVEEELRNAPKDEPQKKAGKLKGKRKWMGVEQAEG